MSCHSVFAINPLFIGLLGARFRYFLIYATIPSALIPDDIIYNIIHLVTPEIECPLHRIEISIDGLYPSPVHCWLYQMFIVMSMEDIFVVLPMVFLITELYFHWYCLLVVNIIYFVDVLCFFKFTFR